MNSTTQQHKSQDEVSEYPIPACVVYFNSERTKQHTPTAEKVQP